MDRGSRIAWEAQWPNGQCTGLHVERHGFETLPGQCAMFLDEFRDVRNCNFSCASSFGVNIHFCT